MKKVSTSGIIVAIIIIALPIVWFCLRLSAINSKYESGNSLSEIQTNIDKIIEDEVNNRSTDEQNYAEEPTTSGEESHTSPYGNPISKVIENAKINVTSANVYQEPDDTSISVAAIYKDTTVTVQDYPNGWSNIKFGDISGWIKSEYVTNPEDLVSNPSLVSAIGHSAEVLVDTLNVRESAVNGAVIDAVHLGDVLNIIGANEDESWFQVQYGVKSGWVSGSRSFIKVNTDN